MTNRPAERTPGTVRSSVDDTLLAVALADLASVLDLPAVPDIATAVRLRLGSEKAPHRRARLSVPWLSRWPRRALVIVPLLLVILLIAAGVAAAIGFGLPGLQIIFSGATPPPATAPATPPATAAANASPSGSQLPSAMPSAELPLDLGTPTTLAQARTSVTFTVFMPEPARLGGLEPAVFRDDRVLGGAIVLAYPAGEGLPVPPSGPIASSAQSIGLLVTESRGLVEQALLEKMLGPGTTITPVKVNGQAGLWISGRPHSLLILDSSGQPVEVTLRQVGDVLVWVQGGTLIRIESPLGLAATLAIARSMR